MDVSSPTKRIEKIPAATRVRILYEAVPWERRKDFGRKIMDPAIKPTACSATATFTVPRTGDPCWSRLSPSIGAVRIITQLSIMFP